MHFCGLIIGATTIELCCLFCLEHLVYWAILIKLADACLIEERYMTRGASIAPPRSSIEVENIYPPTPPQYQQIGTGTLGHAYKE